MRSLPDLLEAAAGRHPDRLAISDAAAQLTYAQLHGRVAAFAGRLKRQGLVPGDRVGIVLESSWQFVVALYGVLRAGGIAVPLNFAARSADLAGWIRHGTAKWVIADPKARECVLLRDELASEVEWIDPPASDEEIQDGPATDSGILGGDMPACIHYTSGTTGSPKGVLLSHGNLTSNALSIVQYLGLAQDSSIVCVLPFYYAYGSSVLHSHIACGGRVIIEKGFTFPHLTMQAIVRERATGFAGVPSTYALLLARVNVAEHDFSSLQYLTQAGGAMSPALTLKLCAAFPGKDIFVMYGQTEATSRISYLPPARLDEKLGSVGIPIPGVEWQVRTDDGTVCPQGETGQVWVKGPNVMLEYWNNPEATRHVLQDGWLCTGDMGKLDAEGFLYIEGRRSDIIKVGAHRVHPQDVENVIAELDGIEDVAVVGIEDELLGEVIKACVVLGADARVSEQQIRRHCLERLANYKVPKQVEFVTDLPRTASGKLRRHALVNRK